MGYETLGPLGVSTPYHYQTDNGCGPTRCACKQVVRDGFWIFA